MLGLDYNGELVGTAIPPPNRLSTTLLGRPHDRHRGCGSAGEGRARSEPRGLLQAKSVSALSSYFII